MTKQGQPPDDVSSAPESGTVRDETSGNKPSDRNNNQGSPPASQGQDKTSVAGEER